MMTMQHGKGAGTRVVAEFVADDLGTPFKVILQNCVRVATDDAGEMISYTIPDPDGLIRAVTFSRLLHSQKLSGPELKWLRKATGSKQLDIARAISMSPEHLSRCEAGTVVMSAASEKLLRIYLCRTAARLHKMKECEEKDKVEALIHRLFDSHELVCAHDADQEFAIHMCRRHHAGDAGNDNDDGWDDVKAAAVN